MEEKAKAKELIDKFLPYANKGGYYTDVEYITGIDEIKNAKQCALICVDEILEAIDWHENEFPNTEIEYWEKVKTEIENYEL